MSAHTQENQIDEIPALRTLVKYTLVVCLVLALIAGGILLTSRQYGPSIARGGYSDDPSRLEVVIGNDVLYVPSNMVRLPHQRVSGTTNSIELFMHWPTRSGYTHDLAPHFNNIEAGKGQIVFVTLRQRNTLLDMRDRFDPIYRKAVGAKTKTVLGGLTVRELNPELGYVDEVLVHGPLDGLDRPQFIARCLEGREGAMMLANCDTDIFVGRTLDMRVRFSDSLLREWPKLQDGFERIADALLAKPDPEG